MGVCARVVHVWACVHVCAYSYWAFEKFNNIINIMFSFT